MANPIFKFGMHAGKPLVSVPAQYMSWVLKTIKTLDPELKAAIQAELARRAAAKEAREAQEQRPTREFRLPKPDIDEFAAENLRALLGFWNEAMHMVDQASPLRPELRELLDRLFAKAGTIGFRLATAAASSAVSSHSEPPTNPLTGYPRPRPEYMAWLGRQCAMPGAVLPLRPDANSSGDSA